MTLRCTHTSCPAQSRGPKIRVKIDVIMVSKGKRSNRQQNGDGASLGPDMPYSARLRQVSPKYAKDLKDGDKPCKRERMVDYADVATMHGVYYVFEKNVIWPSRFFWALCCIGLFVMAIVLIVQVFLDWDKDPIITTVSTTGHPVEDVPFPSITLCALGTIEQTMENVLQKQAVRFLASKGIANPIQYFQDEDKSVGESLDEIDQLDAFMWATYPGLEMDPLRITTMLTSQDPDALLRAELSMAGGVYNECDDNYAEATAAKRKKRAAGACPPGYTFSAISEVCVMVPSGTYTEDEMYDACIYGEVFSLWNDEAITELGLMIEAGHVPGITSGVDIFVDNHRDGDDEPLYRFEWNEGYIAANTFANLTLGAVDDPEWTCFQIHYLATSKKFQGRQADCGESKKVVCISWQEEAVDCSAAAEAPDANATSWRDGVRVEPILNPTKNKALRQGRAKKELRFRSAFAAMNITAAYPNLFELLWYSQLPCFDVKGVTPTLVGKRTSMLKRCKWKGKTMSCASIFKQFPTDRGMCCTFNMKAADEIFKESQYSTWIKLLQERDANSSLKSSAVPDWYTYDKEPMPQPGMTKGLEVMLDAHTNLVAPSSVREDFQGFIAVINSPDSYPLTLQNSLRIRAGHDNLVSMTAIDVTADTNIKSVDVEKRKCYFTDETDNIMHHANYSHANCLLECQLEQAMATMTNANLTACIPWYLPNNGTFAMCDPWSAVKFRDFMKDVGSQVCKHCRPDCQGTSYFETTTVAPFRRCDSKNLGVSSLCTFNDKDLPSPPIFGDQLIREYEVEEFNWETPSYILGRFSKDLSNTRLFSTEGQELFKLSRPKKRRRTTRTIATSRPSSSSSQSRRCFNIIGSSEWAPSSSCLRSEAFSVSASVSASAPVSKSLIGS